MDKVQATLYKYSSLKEEGENMTEKDIPIWEQYTLTINEASKYFRIGETKLRQLIADDPTAEYLLTNGNRVLIKRKMFEEYIDSATVV